MIDSARANMVWDTLSHGSFDFPPVPKRFLCPISQLIMTDPVVISSGQTFDRPSIMQWFRSCYPPTCPVTRAEIEDPCVMPANVVLRSEIHEWLDQQRASGRPLEPLLPTPPQQPPGAKREAATQSSANSSSSSSARTNGRRSPASPLPGLIELPDARTAAAATMAAGSGVERDPWGFAALAGASSGNSGGSGVIRSGSSPHLSFSDAQPLERPRTAPEQQQPPGSQSPLPPTPPGSRLRALPGGRSQTPPPLPRINSSPFDEGGLHDQQQQQQRPMRRQPPEDDPFLGGASDSSICHCLDTILACFALLDADGDGVIGRHELADARHQVATMAQLPDDMQVHLMDHGLEVELQSGSSGEVNKAEFVAAMAELFADQEGCDAQELRHLLLLELQSRLPDEELSSEAITAAASMPSTPSTPPPPLHHDAPPPHQTGSLLPPLSPGDLHHRSASGNIQRRGGHHHQQHASVWPVSAPSSAPASTAGSRPVSRAASPVPMPSATAVGGGGARAPGFRAPGDLERHPTWKVVETRVRDVLTWAGNLDGHQVAGTAALCLVSVGMLLLASASLCPWWVTRSLWAGLSAVVSVAVRTVVVAMVLLAGLATTGLGGAGGVGGAGAGRPGRLRGRPRQPRNWY